MGLTRGAQPEASTAPWKGQPVTWHIDGEDHTASYNPGELVCMRTAREQGASTAELEALHMAKVLLDATIVDAEATP